MEAALCVSRAGRDREANLAGIESLVVEASRRGAQLALFPEAALTGLVNDDDPVHDLPLGVEIPGPTTQRLGQMAKRAGIYLVIGLLEREGMRLYDSAVAFDPQGQLALKYRRIQPQWHGRKADPKVYRQGTDVEVLTTPWGRMVVLLCGDLFDDELLQRVRALRPAYLLVPMSRSFPDGSCDQARWDHEDMAQYAQRAAVAGCTTLIVNSLEERDLTPWPAFGGAWVVDGNGEVRARWPLGEVGMRVVDV